jgi:RimJ/RimL family protein N-acetyltransferase
MVVINSKYFKLRPLRKKDGFSLVKHLNDPAIAKNTLNIPYPYTNKDAQKWINHNLRILKEKKKKEIIFAIEIDEELAGCISLMKICGHSAEIGYWLGKDYRGQGIMMRAVKLVTNYAFRELNLKRIYAYVFMFNRPSVRVLEKAGYKCEGKLRKDVFKGNRFLDNYVFAKIKR